MAGLRAEGTTEIADADHIDRGYEEFPERLRELGARIERA
jgi:UDP-N-acetylglucosamine 1-carboxyvinyltransferase